MVKYINECRDLDIRILPPDINVSDLHFTPQGSEIRFGMMAIKNVGTNAINSILKGRGAISKFRSIFELCEQTDSHLVNKRMIESLIKAGALDSFGRRRSELFATVDKAIESAQKIQRDRESGQQGLFADNISSANGYPYPGEEPELPDIAEWPQSLLLSNEKEALGFYITGHPLTKFFERLKTLSSANLENINEMKSGNAVQLGAMINSLRILRTKRGDRMAILSLEDLSGSIEAVVFPENF